ncbi:hypothetical protein UFOVP99_24 [uncultured Caudovirales phage]|uniref:Uncharacterized protein n=1 Tax=uncultured Caudovirales phage TaxID=2100421 RepID=A0A6J5L517_9CAUD|nr:hypothetical protein UFOVP99_24 [uncultured Caudovirales phage]
MDLAAILGWLTSLLTAVGGASLLAAILPRPAAGTALANGFQLLDLLAANWMNARNARKLALLLCLPLLSACSLADLASLTPAIAPATSCAMGVAGAIEAHASSDEPDAQKALGSAQAVLTNPACAAALQALASAAKG